MYTKFIEEKANEILSYYVPKFADWNADDKCFYFFDNGYGWSMYSDMYVKSKNRRFWNANTGVIVAKSALILLMNLNLKDLKKRSAIVLTVGLKLLSQ